MSTNRTAPIPTLGTELITEKRQKIDVDGYIVDHGKQGYRYGLAAVAACYLATATAGVPRRWPWRRHYWKPTPIDRMQWMAEAGALIAAEIDRLVEAEYGLTGSSGDE